MGGKGIVFFKNSFEIKLYFNKINRMSFLVFLKKLSENKIYVSIKFNKIIEMNILVFKKNSLKEN